MKTDYIGDRTELARHFDLSVSSKRISISGHLDFEIQSWPFKSTAGFVYPDTGDYCERGSAFTSLLRYYCEQNRYSNEFIFNALEHPDREIRENMSFRIPVILPAEDRIFSKAIILLHGLNEKHWEKYLPWALRLSEQTDCPVIMFPIAFHMNRAPEAWGNPREMIRVAAERKKLLHNSPETSFVNAALSHRIQFAPHRFFSSGLQTYYDIVNFLQETKQGLHPSLGRNCRIDFFAYSIGASLAEVLLTSGPDELLGKSKLFIFCGGAALDTASPVSKTIIDGDAYNELFRWLSGLFETVTDAGRRMKQIFLQDLPEVLNFKSFLFYDRMQSFRENALRKASNRIRELSLSKDSVFSPEITSKTLNGFSGDIGIKTGHLDFSYNYRHEDPFPLDYSSKDEINAAFDEVFSIASDFFNRSA